MNASTIIWIVVAIVVVLIIVGIIIAVSRKAAAKKRERQREEAAQLRQQAAESEHEVRAREADVERQRADAKLAQAEADARAADAERQAAEAEKIDFDAVKREEAVKAERLEHERKLQRADELDPESPQHTGDSRRAVDARNAGTPKPGTPHDPADPSAEAGNRPRGDQPEADRLDPRVDQRSPQDPAAQNDRRADPLGGSGDGDAPRH
ncbi:hypothetical protein [Brevibacterium limosum]|uniref:hypothetical protein n=1 Tax=Brevibacterium limosum TaxID=2697565 RepID=UPI00141FD54D|nr:hypothetical protein [Brevibacterium limosum]